MESLSQAAHGLRPKWLKIRVKSQMGRSSWRWSSISAVSPLPILGVSKGALEAPPVGSVAKHIFGLEKP